MKPYKLDSSVVDKLNVKINDEYSAHYFYRQAANFCQDAGYFRAAKYFAGEAEEELEHAHDIEKYLTDWNCMPALKSISSPESVEDLVDILEKAYKMEYALYDEYESISKEIFTVDLCTFDFLQKFRKIQTESVANYSDFLNELELIDKSDKNWVYMFEKKAFKDK